MLARKSLLIISLEEEYFISGVIFQGVVGRNIEERGVGFTAHQIGQFVGCFANAGIVALAHRQNFEIG